MKRFLVFYGDQYYPAGGWGDFKGEFDTFEEAVKFLVGKSFDWKEVVDCY
jgi:hypothetical protein